MGATWGGGGGGGCRGVAAGGGGGGGGVASPEDDTVALRILHGGGGAAAAGGSGGVVPALKGIPLFPLGHCVGDTVWVALDITPGQLTLCTVTGFRQHGGKYQYSVVRSGIYMRKCLSPSLSGDVKGRDTAPEGGDVEGGLAGEGGGGVHEGVRVEEGGGSDGVVVDLDGGGDGGGGWGVTHWVAATAGGVVTSSPDGMVWWCRLTPG